MNIVLVYEMDNHFIGLRCDKDYAKCYKKLLKGINSRYAQFKTQKLFFWETEHNLIEEAPHFKQYSIRKDFIMKETE